MGLRLSSLQDKDTFTKLVSDLFRNLLVIYIIFLMLSYLSPGNVEFYIDLKTFINYLIVLGAVSLIFYVEKLKKFDKIKFDKVNSYISYAFIVLLLKVTIESILSQPEIEWDRTPLKSVLVALGVVTFYINRNRLEDIKEDEWQEKIEEKKRDIGFSRTYPRLNRLWGVRWIVSWMYREGWWYSGGLFFIVLLGAFFRFWGLSALSYNQDEGLYVLLTNSIKQNLFPILPSGLIYVRGFFFTYITYISTVLFGVNEFSIRLSSVIFGLLLIILVYFFGRDLFNKNVGILSSFLVAVDLIMIAFSREGRFYMQFVFLFTLTVYLFFKVYEKNEKNLQLPLLLSLLFSLETHDLSVFMIFFFGLFLFIHNKNLLKKKSTYIILFPFIIFAIYYYIKDFLFNLSTNTQRLDLIAKPILNLQTINLSLQNPNFVYYYNTFYLNYPIFIFIAILAISRYFNTEKNKNILLITYPILIYFIIMSFFAGLSNLRFMIHIIPLFLIIVAFGIIIVSRAVCNLFSKKGVSKSNKKLLLLSVLIIFSFNLINGHQLSSINYNSIEERKETKSLLDCYGLLIQGKFYAFQSVMTHQTKIDYRSATEYVINHRKKEDIIITTDNYYSNYPYIKPDYNTDAYISSYLGYIINDKRYDMYTGTEIITNLDQMKSIMSSNKSIWVIAESRFERHGDKEVVKYIKDNFKQVYSTDEYDNGLNDKYTKWKNIFIYYKN